MVKYLVILKPIRARHCSRPRSSCGSPAQDFPLQILYAKCPACLHTVAKDTFDAVSDTYSGRNKTAVES
jgi:hypothetical protein